MIVKLMTSPDEHELPYSIDRMKEMMSAFDRCRSASQKRLLVKQLGECRAGKTVAITIAMFFSYGCGYTNFVLMANLEAVNDAIPKLKRETFDKFNTEYYQKYAWGGGAEWQIYTHGDFTKLDLQWQNRLDTPLDNPHTLVLLLTHTAVKQPLSHIGRWLAIESRRKSTAIAYDEVHNTMTEEPNAPL